MANELLITQHFTVGIPERPHVDRLDGGHIIIWPKVPVRDRTQLSMAQACELMKLTMIVGEAMETVLKRRGVDVVRINYQDNGNWGFHSPLGPRLHIHLYGRAFSSRIQEHGEALYLPRQESFYDGLCALNQEDAVALRAEIQRIMASPKYQQPPIQTTENDGRGLDRILP